MEDKSKSNGIGHNSNFTEEVAYYGQPPITKATLELVREAKKTAAEALEMLQEVKVKYVSAFKGERPLTKKQEDWNYNVDKYNDWIMDNNPNSKTNTKHLRKKYKPEKLSMADRHEQFHEAQKLWGDCWVAANDTDMTLRQIVNPDGILHMLSEDEIEDITKMKGGSDNEKE